MDHATCHVVYVDKRAYKERYERSDMKAVSDSSAAAFEPSKAVDGEVEELKTNLRSILSVFPGVYVCTSGTSCIAKVRELHESSRGDFKPTFVIIDTLSDLNPGDRTTPHDDSTKTPISSPTTAQHHEIISNSETLRNLWLVKHIDNEIACFNLSRLTILIAVVHSPEGFAATNHSSSNGRLSHRGLDGLKQGSGSTDKEATGIGAPLDPKRIFECLDAGAVDVLTSPLHADRVYSLTTHAYRAHKEALKDQAAFLATKRQRKRSWVGVDDERPYSYLRESMVSNLMTNICEPDTALRSFDPRYVTPKYTGMDVSKEFSIDKHESVYIVDQRREIIIAKAIGSWNFPAHEFSEDELLHAAFLMLKHALRMPELQKYRLPADDLKNFLMACRAAYNGFVLYHNFRHVVDVLQAVFYFLIQLRTIPPHPADARVPDAKSSASPIAALLKPFDALTLLISAIGHDVGHPGVNNAFLVALKAPLAQLYNDNSVLESFHCAAYSQILRQYWTVAAEDINLRRLLIKSILATDMGVHFRYMTELGNLQEKLHHNGGTDGWSIQLLEEYKTLTCGLLIKCADISNVARPFRVAEKWSNILQLEFAKQGEMEKDLGIPTTLFGGPPELGNLTKLANSQLGFMNMFAYPLFESVTDILPGMQFAVDEIKANQGVWKKKIEEQKRIEASTSQAERRDFDGFQSPRSLTPDRPFATSPESSHPEGLPASGASPAIPESAVSPIDRDRDARRSSPGFQSAAPVDINKPSTQSRNSSRPQSVGHITGPQSGHASDAMSFSRRSSGAFPAANILPPVLSTRRSSNTVPSQLQLNLRHGSDSSNDAVAENVRPVIYPTDNLPSSAISGIVSGGVFASPSHTRNGGINGGSGGSGSSPYRRENGNYVDTGGSHSFYRNNQHFSRPLSSRHSTQPSSGRYSALSSQDRFSNTTSGATTLASHFLPVSPTETQATSFLTDGSDVGHAEDFASSVPDITDIERPGSGYHFKSYDENLDRNGSSTDEVNTETPSTNGHTTGERVVRKKGSRFRFDFWKRKGNKHDSSTSSLGSP